MRAIRRKQGPAGRPRDRDMRRGRIPAVARSNILLLTTMGAGVRVVAPSRGAGGISGGRRKGRANMREGLNGADIVMMLRLSGASRMNGEFVPSTRNMYHYSGRPEEVAYARPTRR